ncbi:pentapeptide repeat-containing protein [Streptomyces fradiae]|uniref:pentapeptide repeat-containing protein n=1 Tax=Streptomyces fradiae TaxID=1906 RepID=UPI003514EC6E
MQRKWDLGRLRVLARRQAAGRAEGGPAAQPQPGAGAGAGARGSRLQWWALGASTLPGLAAVAAVWFTWAQVGQAAKEVRVAETGQITDRFNTAIANLASTSPHVRLGGIYALGRIEQDSPRDDPAVTSVLSAYVRDRAPLSARKPAPAGKPHVPPSDVAAALTVLANRRVTPTPFLVDLKEVDLRGLEYEDAPVFGDLDTAKRNFRYVDLSGSDLSDSNLSWADFYRATLEDAKLTDLLASESDFREASLNTADLTRATLTGSDFTHAQLPFADLSGAVLSKADESVGFIARNTELVGALLWGTNLTGADLRGVNLRDAYLAEADLTRADLTGANLSGANLSGADHTFAETGATLARTSLRNADLRGADLRDVDLRSADLRGADLRGARLAGARLTGAKTDARTKGLPGETG